MNIKDVSSAQNPLYKTWLSLLESRGIKNERRALVSGRRVLAELIEQDPTQILEFLLPPGINEPPVRGVPTYRLTPPLFQSLDVIGTRSTLAIIRAPELESWEAREPDGLELIVALSDPSNLGALLRSADAFGARRVILTEECASPYLPRATRAASGSTFRLSLERTGPLAHVSTSHGPICGLDALGDRITHYDWPQNVYLVLGEEGRGLPSRLALTRLRIPMQSQVESLNATVAASIALFSYRQIWPLS
ncbi:MAG: TrmH family RNA methyltransferase [Bdellovibrionales bacterium]